MSGAAPIRPVATVIAPAFNEERAMPVVLAALAPLRDAGIDVLVVDDGSTDRTAEIARQAGVRVVQLERNSGKAAAVRAGLAEITSDKVVVIDADGTYPADAIPEIVRLLDDHDVVVGVRTRGRENIPPLNRIGNSVIRTAVHWFSGFRSADPLTGLYGLRRAHLIAMKLDSDGFGLEVEIGVKAARMGLRWIDHPITYGERIGESKLSAVRDGLVITRTLIRTLFGRPRLRPLPGREGVAAAPLAVVAAAVSIMLLALAAISLTATTAISLAAVIDPAVPFTLAAARAGLVTLFAGLVLWRVITHWGQPPPETLLRLIAGAVVATAAIVLVVVLGARQASLVPADPRFEVAGWALIVSAILFGIGGMIALAGGRLGPLDPARARDRVRAFVTGRRGELIGLAVVLALLALPVLRFISLGQLLGFDESIYAATSRSWLFGTPNSAWSADRSPGISVLGLPMAWLGSDAALRLVGAGFGLAAVAAGWALARRVGGPAAGLFAALLIATVPGLQLNAGLFLTDVPSAAIFLLVMLVMWVQLEDRPRPNRGILLLAPLVAAAFYLRYGSSVPILFLSASAVVLWPGRLIAAWRLTLATVGLFIVLLLPHLLQSAIIDGNPFAIALSAQSLASPAYPGEALAHYWRILPSDLAGVVGAWFLVLAVVAWPVRIALRGVRHRSVRGHTFLLLPALGQFLLLGLVVLPQVRYVLLPVMLLLVAGSVAAVDLGAQLSRAWRGTLGAGLATAIVVSGIGTAAVMIRLQDEVTPFSAHLAEGARVIRDDAAGRSCSILGYPPSQLIWYSGCAAHHFGYPPVEGRETALSGERRYLVLSPVEYDREPAGSLRERYLRLAEPTPVAIVPDRATGEPALEIYRLRAAD